MALVLFLVFVIVVLAYYVWKPRKVDITEAYIVRASKLLDTVEDADNADSVDQCLVELPGQSAAPAKRMRSKALYSKYVVNLAKNKFGQMSRNQANMAIVRKFVLDEMIEHGVIARHISKTIDAIVETVFVHSDRELVALAIRHTKKAKERAEVAKALAGLPEAA